MKEKYKVPTQTLNKYNYPNTQYYAPTYVKIQFNSNKNALMQYYYLLFIHKHGAVSSNN